MKLSAIAQNPLEWLALKAGMVPVPLAYSHFGFMMSKFLLEATDKGVFEAIGHSEATVEAIAKACQLNERATESLLGVLASMNLLRRKGNVYTLTYQSKKWLLKDSPSSLYWLLMFDQKVCLKWMDYVSEFLQTGKGLQYHDSFTEEEWFYYQKAMEATAKATAKEAPYKIPVPQGATTMLDIGGSHGLYSIALCKKHPTLRSTVFDLPEAIAQSAEVAHEYALQERVSYKGGNILTDDIGESVFDVVVMANVAHHFTTEENIMVAQKVAKALKPGGHFTIVEILKPDVSKNMDMLGALGDFFFALSSTSGTWKLDDIKQWQKHAGLSFKTKRSFLSIPNYVAVTARK